jgi:hypothetical protein
MRQKLNENPMAQVGVVLLLLVAAGFLLLKGMGGGEEGGEETPSTEATVSVAGTGTTGTATGATPGEAVEGAVEAAAEGLAGSTATSAVTTPPPAPPLPKPVSDAYKAGKTVVLLVVHDGGVDEKLARQTASSLGSMPDVDLFVVPVHEVARYAAITLGVNLNRVPALVVMRPKKLSHGTPEASVRYGFQTAQNVEQAVLDANYNGPTVSYHPE